jgi:hypothetical protein
MRDAGRLSSRLRVPALLAVALVGYLIGHAHSGAASQEKLRTASAAHVLLAYPSSWRAAAAAPEIPGLAIAHALVLAPGGDSAHAGLLAGDVPAGEPSPLPRPFVARLRLLPDTTVVNLLEVQAYRYARLSIAGFEPALTLYAIPNPAGTPTVLACYASAGFSAYMRRCEQIVTTLTLVGQWQNYDLTPELGYAAKLRASIGALDERRVALRRELRQGAPPAIVQRLATRLAAGFADAAAALSTLEPSSATQQAQATLSASITQARDAYAALAAAAYAESSSLSADARSRVYVAEAGVNVALESFALLGYKNT